MSSQSNQIEDHLFYEVRDLSEKLGIPRRTIYAAIGTKRTLGAVRVGKLRVEGCEAKRWLRAHYQGALIQ